MTTCPSPEPTPAPVLVHLVLGIFDRWIITRADDPLRAWSGSAWVEHDRGLPTGRAQVSNFSSLVDAILEADHAGFHVETIDRTPV